MKMKRLFIPICILLTAVGCVRYDIEELLISRDDVSLTWKGVEQFSYDPAGCQLGFDASGNEFRALSDNLSKWFILKCSQIPDVEGEELEADISWTGPTDTRTMKGLTFKVRKVTEDGMVWLWCKSAKIGVTIKRL